MKDRLFPILFALIVLSIIFGGWFIGRDRGWFIRNSINDISISRTINCDTVYIDSRNIMYAITSWEARRYNDDILHLKIGFNKGYGESITLNIDTLNTHYLDIFGKILSIKDIPVRN
ncbi:hypothetical protein JGH11_13510 [Dysgonomonas sp. Marseille-P4677]|uniref:hypothetical protein n=1 Tax=Dysgonomonas sp. Marseille-P4677 TaxID=2364790 RepID=UPI001913E397|nr:hypothetical protein [Dysgonomonas sp. Marseille-P4677]MBK5721891.1 hypothetical protein [Dysgonomonas sp. Marseille-P4677]